MHRFAKLESHHHSNYPMAYTSMARASMKSVHNQLKRFNSNSEKKILDYINMKTYKKKPNTKKQKKKGIIKKRIPRLIQSKTKLIRVRATDHISMTCASGAIDGNVINVMSVNDPFVTDSNVQPLGYDQWATMYNKATVVGCKVSVSIYNSGTTALVYGMAVMPQSKGSTTLPGYEYYKEYPSNKARILSPDVDHGYMTITTAPKKHLHAKNILQNDDYAQDLDGTSTSPTETYFIHYYIQPISKSGAATADAIVDVDYIVALHDPIIPGRSAHV